MPGCLSSFLPRGFGLPSNSPPGESPGKEAMNDASIEGGVSSMSEVEELRDRLLVGRRELVLVHLLRRDPAVVVHLLVIDVTAQEPAAVDAEVDVVVRIGMLHVD